MVSGGLFEVATLNNPNPYNPYPYNPYKNLEENWSTLKWPSGPKTPNLRGKIE